MSDKLLSLAQSHCPIGERDPRSWLLACLSRKQHVPIEEAYHLQEHLHANMEQPPGDTFSLETCYEKVARIYNPDTINLKQRIFDQQETPAWKATPRIFPDNLISSNLNNALAYLAAGVAVIPTCWTDDNGQCLAEGANHGKNCRSPGKMSLVKWKEYQDRLPSQNEITAWWQQWPDANIAGITGAVSQLVVLDFDDKQLLYQHPHFHLWLETTPVVETARGGHVYFHTSQPMRNAHFTGIDVKGDGGYVMLPPSLHKSGHEYTRLDRAEGNIISVEKGLARFIMEAVEAQGISLEKKFAIVRLNPYEEIPGSIIHRLEEKDYDIAKNIQTCGATYRWWQDEDGHRALLKHHCHERGCTCRARAQARDYIERNTELWQQLPAPWLFRIETGLIQMYIGQRHKEVRALLKKQGITGDLAIVPTGETDEAGWPVFDLMGVVDRPIATFFSGIEITERQVHSAPAVMLQVIFAAYSGAVLWDNPNAWYAWWVDSKGGHKVRGIENGKRVSSKPKKRPVLCPCCGKQMHQSPARSQTQSEVKKLLEQGAVGWVNGVLMAINSIRGSPQKPKTPQVALI